MSNNIILQVENLRKNFGSFQAVKGLDFVIEKGRCIALLGQNGAGKTTTLHMLAQITSPSAGSIRYFGSKEKDARSSLGFLPQYPKFYNWMTPKELLQFTGKLSNIESRERTERIERIASLVGLDKAMTRKIGGFSGGMKQRLGLAQALLHEPQILLLDEPVSSLDPVGRRDVMNLLHELKGELTIFFSTHVLSDADEICDDIFIMKDGKIEVAGDVSHLKRQGECVSLKIKTTEKISSWFIRMEGIDNIFHETPYLMHLEVGINKLEQVEKGLLEQILVRKISLEKWEIVERSLEDLFLKVVKSDGMAHSI